jgi:hypothetical protein
MLRLSDVKLYYSQVFQQLGKTITDKDLDFAVQATRGYAYLLQLVGYYILKLVGDATIITHEMVEAAATSAKEDLVSGVFEASLKPLSSKDREFLVAMSQDGNTSTIASVQDRMGVTPSYAQQYRQRLIEQGIISSKRRGELEFNMPFMSDYLAGRMGT